MRHYCDFKIITDDDSAQVEVCRECKRKLVTRKGIKGRIDNVKYLKEHVRDTCQPEGTTAKVFARYYGKPKV